jgi:hypothetical protein
MSFLREFEMFPPRGAFSLFSTGYPGAISAKAIALRPNGKFNSES